MSYYEASNGNELMDILIGKRIDLLLLDLVMPEKSGLEALLDIRQKYPDLNVVVMTGEGGGDEEIDRIHSITLSIAWSPGSA